MNRGGVATRAQRGTALQPTQPRDSLARGVGDAGDGLRDLRRASTTDSDGEIDHRVAASRRELQGRWDACQDYLASIAWPALRFRVTNHAQSFLTNVQVILTFHGAAGLEFAAPRVRVGET